MDVTEQNSLGAIKGAHTAAAGAFQGNACVDEPAQLYVQRRVQRLSSCHCHCAGCQPWCPQGYQALPSSLQHP